MSKPTIAFQPSLGRLVTRPTLAATACWQEGAKEDGMVQLGSSVYVPHAVFTVVFSPQAVPPAGGSGGAKAGAGASAVAEADTAEAEEGIHSVKMNLAPLRVAAGVTAGSANIMTDAAMTSQMKEQMASVFMRFTGMKAVTAWKVCARAGGW